MEQRIVQKLGADKLGPRVWDIGQPALELFDQPRFADARLANDQQ
jgi:hypothetical protein